VPTPSPKRGLRYRRRTKAGAGFPAATIAALALVMGSLVFAEWFRAEEVAEVVAEANAAPTRGLGDIPVFGICTEDKQGSLPATLDEALAELGRLLDDDQRALLRDYEPYFWHHGLGTALRNCWGLWTEHSPLGDWFREQGVFHPDDMSSIVLASFHRRLNGKAIDLPGQMAHYQAYWKRQEEEYQKGTDSGNVSYPIIQYSEAEGWGYLSAKSVPHIRDLVDPLMKRGGARVRACWQRFPRSSGQQAETTSLRVRIRDDGMLTSAEVVESELPAEHALCLAHALLDIPVPAHAGASYVIELATYRNAQPQ
jgi:hypothetical protein